MWNSKKKTMSLDLLMKIHQKHPPKGLENLLMKVLRLSMARIGQKNIRNDSSMK